MFLFEDYKRQNGQKCSMPAEVVNTDTIGGFSFCMIDDKRRMDV